MVTFKSYEKYKYSGVEWIGEIPHRWKVLKLKYLSKNIQTGTTPSTRYEEYFDGDINWFTPGDFSESKSLFESGRKVSELAVIDNEVKILPKGTVLLVGIGATLGKVAVLENDSSFNQQITGIETKEVYNSSYLYYWLWINKDTIYQIANFTTLPIINNQFIKEFYCIVPSLEEQKRIADFLDQKTSEIDKLIADKEKLIELLEEKRQAIITEAVTKGLNPNVKMKDSGVEWIREIPEHWDIQPLFTLFKESKKKNVGNKEQNVLSLSYGKIIRRDVETNFGLLPESFETYQIVEKGYIVLRLTDLQNDKRSLRCGLVKEKGIITSAYVSLVPNDTINEVYAYYLLHAYDLFKVFYGLGSGVRQSMGFSDLKRVPILLPPKDEQNHIAEYLDEKNKEIDSLIIDLKKQITNLKEYRQSLIYEAVTGKIDVRDYVKA